SVGGNPAIYNLGYYSSDECAGSFAYGPVSMETSILGLGEYLRRYLNEHFAGQYVNLVVHSMGGLIARAALKYGPGPAPKINHVVTLDSPHSGTPLTCEAIFLPGIYPVVFELTGLQGGEMCLTDPTGALDDLLGVPAYYGRTSYWATIGSAGSYCL